MSCINIGDRVRDIVTGFEGIVVGHTKWFTGCDNYGLQPGLDKDGKIQELTWLDSNRLKLVQAGVAVPPAPKSSDGKPVKTGGPQPTPRTGNLV